MCIDDMGTHAVKINNVGVHTQMYTTLLILSSFIGFSPQMFALKLEHMLYYDGLIDWLKSQV